jgi:thiol-disulfide isomerase/thioredoxin
MKFRRILSGVIVITLIGFSVFWAVNSKKEISLQEESSLTKKELRRMMADFKPSPNNSSQFEVAKPTLLLYFNSECEHCKEELVELQELMSYTNDIQICLVSYQEFEQVMPFINECKLNKYQNVFLFKMQADKVLTTFGKSIVPQSFVYNKNVLVKSKVGKADLKGLLSMLGL